MKLNTVIALLLFVPGAFAQEDKGIQYFDRPAFYAAIASAKIESINSQLTAIKSASIGSKEAFEGALLMTKAGLVSNPTNKLSFFKSGVKKLESSIKREGKNVEYRFLRLMIQENVPRFLNYYEEINEDSKLVQSSFKSLAPEVQQAVVNYKKKSKALKEASF